MLEELRRITVFADLTEEQLAWLAEHGELVELAAGEAVVHEGDPAEAMLALVEGEFRARREKGPPDGRLIVVHAGEVSGMLPFSRLTIFPVTSRAVVPSRVIRFSKEIFPEMLRRIPVLEPRLVAVMNDRVREAARAEQQRETLMALGRLSAGLAHELNNPAAAVRRSASELRERLGELRRLMVELVEQGTTAADLRTLVEVQQHTGGEGAHSQLDPLLRSEREEELAEWLERHGVEQGWVLAESLVAAELQIADLEALGARLPAAALPAALGWLAGSLGADAMLREVEEAARRISALVSAVKSYSHMDQTPEMGETDVHMGIESTLAMVTHKLREKRIVVTRRYDPELPHIWACAGELNQVWTNLIDNAITAMQPEGQLRIRTAREESRVLVEVEDNGAGIPPELQARIFEPFFTTRDVGEGTGLGLDIVSRIVTRRHGGEVRVESEPGRTCFQVHLPIGMG